MFNAEEKRSEQAATNGRVRPYVAASRSGSIAGNENICWSDFGLSTLIGKRRRKVRGHTPLALVSRCSPARAHGDYRYRYRYCV